MDRNRKILISILALLVLSSIIAIVDIGLDMQHRKKTMYSISVPRIGPGVGIVRIDGPIGMSGRSGVFGSVSGTERIIQRLDAFEKNSDIKAVIVRINSPGGTVAATQEIYQKLWKLRKKNIQIVASLGEIAASGGYYIASACNCIVANYGTITGSIGVIAYSPNLKRLFEKLGIRMNVIKSGKYKDILSSHRDLSGEDRALLQQMIDTLYKKFLKDVALGRNLNQSDIRPYADGRVMIGVTALKYKLIDMLGTFEDAVDKARVMAKLPEDSPIYDEDKSPFHQFLMLIESMANSRNILEQNLKYDNIYKLEYRYLR